MLDDDDETLLDDGFDLVALLLMVTVFANVGLLHDDDEGPLEVELLDEAVE